MFGNHATWLFERRLLTGILVSLLDFSILYGRGVCWNILKFWNPRLEGSSPTCQLGDIVLFWLRHTGLDWNLTLDLGGCNKRPPVVLFDLLATEGCLLHLPLQFDTASSRLTWRGCIYWISDINCLFLHKFKISWVIVSKGGGALFNLHVEDFTNKTRFYLRNL